jgi:release factor glutamine methyltransferase
MSAAAPPPRWTVLTLLNWTADHLASKGFDEARLHVEHLLARVLKLRRIDLYLQFDRPLTDEERAEFKVLYNRRLAREPLQHILGDTEFMKMNLRVSPAALIPRPETELLVEQAIRALRESAASSPRILDIGTGTGNIALALAHEFKDATVIATDISAMALELARQNAGRNGISSVSFIEDDFRATCINTDKAFQLVISNPPYIPVDEIARLDPEVKDHEPHAALTDEGNGLSFYPRIAAFAKKSLVPGGWVMVEVGYGQAARVAEIFSDAGLQSVSVTKDYANIERIVEARS